MRRIEPMRWEKQHLATKEISVRLPEIVGKQRPRTVRHNGTIKTYTPRKTRESELIIANEWLSHFGYAYATFTDEVHLSVVISRELAKSNPKFWEGRSDVHKPDIDNILKLVMDALNGIAYKDDSQVTTCEITKSARTKFGEGCILKILINYYKEVRNEHNR